MIVKDKTDVKTEDHKQQLGLTGDVYVVGHFIENLESHKRLIPQSTATTIEEAEQERLEYIRAEEERIAALAAEAESSDETENDTGGADYDA